MYFASGVCLMQQVHQEQWHFSFSPWQQPFRSNANCGGRCVPLTRKQLELQLQVLD